LCRWQPKEEKKSFEGKSQEKKHLKKKIISFSMALNIKTDKTKNM